MRTDRSKETMEKFSEKLVRSAERRTRRKSALRKLEFSRELQKLRLGSQGMFVIHRICLSGSTAGCSAIYLIYLMYMSSDNIQSYIPLDSVNCLHFGMDYLPEIPLRGCIVKLEL